jgi:hypothetical protein
MHYLAHLHDHGGLYEQRQFHLPSMSYHLQPQRGFLVLRRECTAHEMHIVKISSPRIGTIISTHSVPLQSGKYHVSDAAYAHHDSYLP